MKKFFPFSALIFLLLLCVSAINADVPGDINHNGEIDLAEAIYARQLATGVYPEMPAYCIFFGKGPWSIGAVYKLCDVVVYNKKSYACILPHTSKTEANNPPNEMYWTLLDINKGFGQGCGT